jgi:hypothetical protein
MKIKQSIPAGRNPLLELCPFCGEPGELYFAPGESGCHVRCSNDACSFRPVSSQSFATEELAIKAWNTRKGITYDTKSVAQAILEETQDIYLSED